MMIPQEISQITDTQRMPLSQWTTGLIRFWLVLAIVLYRLNKTANILSTISTLCRTLYPMNCWLDLLERIKTNWLILNKN